MPRLWEQQWINGRGHRVRSHHRNKDDIKAFNILYNRGCSDNSLHLTAQGSPTMAIVSLEHFRLVEDAGYGKVIQ
jgi:hypothetical protein